MNVSPHKSCREKVRKKTSIKLNTHQTNKFKLVPKIKNNIIGKIINKIKLSFRNT